MKKTDQDVINSLINLFSVNFEGLLNLPCYVFWKNKEGVYLGYNDYGAANLGYDNGRCIAGKNDYKIFPKEMAELYRENDKLAMTEKRQIFVSEKGIIKNNHPVVFLSYKMPLYDKDNTIAGILGLSFTRPAHAAECPSKKDSSPTELAQTCNYCPQHIHSVCEKLSTKERACLQYLCQGLTIKKIAQQLKVAPKTVETHIERAKTKMNCHNKAELILNFIRAGEYT